MPITNTASRYGSVAKGFHWLTALLILTVVPLGIFAHDAPFATDAELTRKALLFSLHKTFGVAIFFTALARILWALTQTKPAGLHPDRKAETFLAETVHWLLYASLVLVPLTGWIHHAASTGFAPIFWPFGQSLPFVPKNEAVSYTFSTLHFLLERVMVFSILLHVAGALKHHFVDKDITLRRMWFGNVIGSAARDTRHTLTPLIGAAGVYAIALGIGAAMGFFAQNNDAPARAALGEVASDWTVQDGTLSITVTQFGRPITGSFTDWTAAIRFDETALETAGDVTATIAIGSLTLGSVTDQAMGADFFDAPTFPTASFTAPIKVDGESYRASGTLALKGAEVPVTLDFTLGIDGNTATMAGRGILDRRAFAIGDNMPEESNLGFAVDVAIALTATRNTQ